MLKIGQRWIRINYEHNYIVEIVEIKPNTSVNCRIVQSDHYSDLLKVGVVTCCYGFPENSYSSECWKYLPAQDAPEKSL